MAFQSPNYTQTPNDLFDSMLPEIGEAELKVTLAAIRRTFGFHRERFRLSLTDMMSSTGMSRPAVIRGAEQAEKRGTLRREHDKGVTIWVVNVVDRQVVNESYQVVNESYQTGKVELPPSIKETSKQRERKKKNGGAHAPDESTDPRSQSPEIQTVRQVIGRYPSKDQYDIVIKLAAGLSFEQCVPAWEEWRKRGYKPTNFSWLDWARNGIPETPNGKRNGSSERVVMPENLTDEDVARLYHEWNPNLVGGAQ